jgi:hypothetical protein
MSKPLSSINVEDVVIQSGSALGMVYLIENYLEKYMPETYSEILKVGLSGATAITLIAPIIQNLKSGAGMFDGIKMDTEILKNMLAVGGASAIIYLLIKNAIPSITQSNAKRYAGIVVSILSAYFVMPKVKSMYNDYVNTPPATTTTN